MNYAICRDLPQQITAQPLAWPQTLIGGLALTTLLSACNPLEDVRDGQPASTDCYSSARFRLPDGYLNDENLRQGLTPYGEHINLRYR